MPCSTIPPGTRAHRVCGRTHRSSRKRLTFSGRGLSPSAMPLRADRPDCGLVTCIHCRSSPLPPTRPRSPEPFSRRISTSNKAWCSSSTSTLNTSCRADVVLTAGICGLAQHSHSGGRFELERFFAQRVSRAVPSCPATPWVAEFHQLPFGPFTTIANINDNGSSALRLSSDQGRDQERSARPLRPAGVHLRPQLRHRIRRRPRYHHGRNLLPLAGRPRSRIGLCLKIQLNHNFTASVIYDLPFGKGKHFGSSWNGAVNAVLGNWQVNVIEKITSGFPVFIVDSNNGSGVNFTNQRKQLEPPRPGLRSQQAEQSQPVYSRWFNTQMVCCDPRQPGRTGKRSTRTLSTGLDFVNTDFSVIKHFPLSFREGMMIDFRAEFFNLFQPSSVLSSCQQRMQDIKRLPVSGSVTRTVNNPRLIQFALKLRF